MRSLQSSWHSSFQEYIDHKEAEVAFDSNSCVEARLVDRHESSEQLMQNRKMMHGAVEYRVFNFLDEELKKTYQNR